MRNTKRQLWTNAICINQKDSVEQSEQIRWVKVVSEQSAVVYPWLGLPIKGTGLAYKKLEQCSNAVWEGGDPLPKEGESARRNFSMTDASVRALLRLRRSKNFRSSAATAELCD